MTIFLSLTNLFVFMVSPFLLYRCIASTKYFVMSSYDTSECGLDSNTNIN